MATSGRHLSTSGGNVVGGLVTGGKVAGGVVVDVVEGVGAAVVDDSGRLEDDTVSVVVAGSGVRTLTGAIAEAPVVSIPLPTAAAEDSGRDPRNLLDRTAAVSLPET